MEYTDLKGYSCHLSFEPDAFGIESKHVLVIAKYNGKWLLTKHRERGLEFPGGKAEAGESLLETAQREVYEETGGMVERLEWFAQYVVYSEHPFCKTVFIGEVSVMKNIEWMETEGPVLMDFLEPDSTFSFMMKDEGMNEIMKRVRLNGKWKD